MEQYHIEATHKNGVTEQCVVKVKDTTALLKMIYQCVNEHENTKQAVTEINAYKEYKKEGNITKFRFAFRSTPMVHGISYQTQYSNLKYILPDGSLISAEEVDRKFGQWKKA